MTTLVSKVKHGDAAQIITPGRWHRIEAGGLDRLPLPRFGGRLRLEYQLAAPASGELPAVVTLVWSRDTDPDDDGDGPTGGNDHVLPATPPPGWDRVRLTNAHVLSDRRELRAVSLRVRVYGTPGCRLVLETRVLKVDRL